MRVLFWALLSIALGVAAGAGASLMTFGDAGPDFQALDLPRGGPRPGAAALVRPQPRQQIEVVEGEEHDFGVMDQGETRSHRFTVRNQTASPLQLRVISTTCKCAVGALENDSIAPGGEGYVTLEWTAKSLDPEFRQSATIGTSSEIRPNLILSVAGRVIQTLRAEPYDLAFSDVPFRDAREAAFTLFGFKHDELAILEHRWVEPETADHFEFEWEPAAEEVVRAEPEARAAVVCRVRLKPGLPLGPLRQSLELSTTALQSGAVEIPIRGRIVGDIMLSGGNFQELSETLIMGPVPRAAGAERRMLMTVKGPHREAFEITGVRTEPADVLQLRVGEVQQLKGGLVKLYPLTVAIPPEARPVNYLGGAEHPLGQVILQTSHPELPEISFRVRFAVTE